VTCYDDDIIVSSGSIIPEYTCSQTEKCKSHKQDGERNLPLSLVHIYVVCY